MRLVTIKSEGLAHNSYFLVDEEEAVVIDPRRDCVIYKSLAQRSCAKIKYVLETHRNEDYVTGSLELQNITDAEIGHSKKLGFKYGEHNLSDEESLGIGNLKIKCLYTPGHTDESLCYAIYKSGEAAPMFVFTGDTLFVGSVGRTDLYGKNIQRTQTEKLHSSLHEKLLPLGDATIIYPAHGSGSLCGLDIGEQDFSSIGYEKKTNPFLGLDETAFADRVLKDDLLLPPYFHKMEDTNLNGPLLLRNRSVPEALGLSDFEKEMDQANTIVVDTRMPYAFAGSFIPGSLSIWLGGTSVYPGWLLQYGQRVLFVHERKEDMKKVATHFWRLGFDCMQGHLCQGMNEWQERGKPISQVLTMSVTEVKARLAKNEVSLVDVREPNEWKDGYIRGAQRIFFGHLADKAESLPKDKPWAVTCSVGNRSSIGASILKRKDFKEVYNVLGGMTAWTNLEYPTIKE